MKPTVTLGDLKARYPGVSLTILLPSPDDGTTRQVAFRPTHRVETRLSDRRVLVDYVRLLTRGRDDDLVQADLDATEFLAAATPEDYATLAHGYSVVKVPTFGYSHRSKTWWPFVCPEPAWTSAVVVATEVAYEPVEEPLDYHGAPRVQVDGDGVYFAQTASEGAIKIGFSTNARRRRGELQTAQPERLTYIAFIPGTVEDERAFHSRFQADRLEGEWFNPEPVLAWLRRRGYVREATGQS